MTGHRAYMLPEIRQAKICELVLQRCEASIKLLAKKNRLTTLICTETPGHLGTVGKGHFSTVPNTKPQIL